MKAKFACALAVFLLLMLPVSASAQQAVPAAPGKTAASPTPPTAVGAKIKITATTPPADLARSALMAHGGDKFRSAKTIILRGSIDFYLPNSVQALPGEFLIITAGERFRQEVRAPPFFNARVISDGQRLYSSVRLFSVPPPNKFGMIVLTRFDQPGYSVTPLPDQKKRRAFRITDPDGNVTNFYIDPATGRVMSYEALYNGGTYTVAHEKFKELGGVLVPHSFKQSLATPQGTFYADYKVKQAAVNQKVSDNMFALPTPTPAK
jgi:hypothetical protein